MRVPPGWFFRDKELYYRICAIANGAMLTTKKSSQVMYASQQIEGLFIGVKNSVVFTNSLKQLNIQNNISALNSRLRLVAVDVIF